MEYGPPYAPIALLLFKQRSTVDEVSVIVESHADHITGPRKATPSPSPMQQSLPFPPQHHTAAAFSFILPDIDRTGKAGDNDRSTSLRSSLAPVQF
jgi:hypothetical protein